MYDLLMDRYEDCDRHPVNKTQTHLTEWISTGAVGD